MDSRTGGRDNHYHGGSDGKLGYQEKRDMIEQIRSDRNATERTKTSNFDVGGPAATSSSGAVTAPSTSVNVSDEPKRAVPETQTTEA